MKGFGDLWFFVKTEVDQCVFGDKKFTTTLLEIAAESSEVVDWSAGVINDEDGFGRVDFLLGFL